MEGFEKYHKIKRAGDAENATMFINGDDEIAEQEKIDGANFRFTYLNGKIVFGSRTQ